MSAVVELTLLRRWVPVAWCLWCARNAPIDHDCRIAQKTETPR